MIAIPSSSVTSISRGAPDAQTDQRRITERDPRVVALRAVWRSRLTRSIGQLVRDLRELPPHGQADAALTRFIHRHVGLLRAAYQEGHALGARDYYAGVSRHPHQWARTVAPDERTERRRLAFYAPSVAKLAHEALLAWQQDQAARVHASEATITLADDSLSQWQSGLGARLTLQADISWSGSQDGYVDAGAGDSIGLYSLLYWILEPVAQHCADCPQYAANSPYNAPGLGGNTLDTAPGAGMTECGAACKCSLSYASPGEIEQPFWDTMFAAKQQEWIASGQQQPGPLPQVAGPARTDTAVTSPLPRRAPPTIPLEPLEPLTLPAEGALLSDEQKAALDLYRATALAWEEWRGGLPPLPKMFADLADDVMGTDPQVNAWLENMPDWTALSAKQQQLLGQVYEALADWALATSEAMHDALALPPDVTGDTTFAEWMAGRRLLLGYNPYRDAHGRFAPGPHAPHEDDASGGGHGGGGGSGHVAHRQLTQQEREAKAQGELDAAHARYQAALDGHRVANGELRAATAHETAMRAAHEDAKRAAEQDLRAQELQAARVREPARYAQYERFAQARANGFDQFRAISARVDVAAQHARDVRAGLVRRGIPQSVVTSHPEYLRAEKEWHDLAREGQVAWQSYRRAQSAMDAAADRLVGARVSEDRINAHPLVVSAHAVHEAAAQRVSELEATRHAFEREAIAADAAVQRAEGMLDVARGGSGVTIKYWQSRAGVSAQDAIRQTFGRDLTEHELAKLSGASIGDKMDVQPAVGAQGGVSVSLRGPEIERRFAVVRDAQTGDIILHDEYTGNKGERTAGSGRDLIRGMDNMREVGVTRLYATAARGPALNGYSTWARMGFVGDVPRGLRMAVQSRFGSGVTRVEQIMQRPGGAAWWKQFGTTWDAEFDFHDGSYSMRRLGELRAMIERHGGGE